MRSNKRRMLPNSKDLVQSFNRRTLPETIKEHNDSHRVEWTDVSQNPREYYVGNEALKIPDASTPRYKLLWPIRYGWLNERDYASKRRLMEDIQIIIEESIKNELGLDKRELPNYRAVLVVPDLYERNYVTDMVELLMKEIRFSEICIIQVCSFHHQRIAKADGGRNHLQHLSALDTPRPALSTLVPKRLSLIHI